MQKELIHQLFSKIRFGGLTIHYWDGTEINYGPDQAKAAIIFRKPLPAGFKIQDPMITFGEAYMDGLIDFSGDMSDLLRVVDQNKEFFYGRQIWRILPPSSRRSLQGAAARKRQKENIQHHYDLGNDFFALWLDENLSYSCAYFRSPEDSLEQAQQQKLDLVLRKLQLKPGEKLLDIGSGWGRLIIRAAQVYGVQATGVTLSEEQFASSQEQIKKLGLSDRVEVLLLDYLDLDQLNRQFDKIVSVGMFEHVGKANLGRYLAKVQQLLVPGGLSLLHSIVGMLEGTINTWSEKYIFPGGYIPSVREIVNLLPDFDFHLIHLESLRLHYALTLDRWYENFNRHVDKITARYGERFVRMWGLYLMTNAASFRSTGLDICQLLFTRGLNNNLPLTCEHFYQPG